MEHLNVAKWATWVYSFVVVVVSVCVTMLRTLKKEGWNYLTYWMMTIRLTVPKYLPSNAGLLIPLKNKAFLYRFLLPPSLSLLLSLSLFPYLPLSASLYLSLSHSHTLYLSTPISAYLYSIVCSFVWLEYKRYHLFTDAFCLQRRSPYAIAPFSLILVNEFVD